MLFWKFPFGRFEFSAHRGGEDSPENALAVQRQVTHAAPVHRPWRQSLALKVFAGAKKKTMVTTVWVNQQYSWVMIYSKQFFFG